MEVIELLDRLDDAISQTGSRGESVRSIALHLETMADTPERKTAVRRLTSAGSHGDLPVMRRMCERYSCGAVTVGHDDDIRA
jgi:hypothetical protein